MDEQQKNEKAQRQPPTQNDARNTRPTFSPYQRSTRHISQAPIDDPEPVYVTRERYQTLDELKHPRKSMGVATSDPDYLTEAPLTKAANQPHIMSQRGPRPKQTLTNTARYLQTPKPGKSIFISSAERKRKTARRFLLLGLLLVVVVVIVIVLALGR